MKTVITAERLITPTQTLHHPVLVVEDERIAELGTREQLAIPTDARLHKFPGKILAPGFIDIHIHGGSGHDVMELSASSLAAIERGMVKHGYGRIINIGSVTSVFGYAGLAPYGASRGGVRQLTMSLADDWGKYGITVNCLAPGWFRTEQNKMLYEDKEWVEYLVDRIPVKRAGQPHDLDGAVVFLASEASRYITGQTLLVDGGISTGAMRATVKPPST